LQVPIYYLVLVGEAYDGDKLMRCLADVGLDECRLDVLGEGDVIKFWRVENDHLQAIDCVIERLLGLRMHVSLTESHRCVEIVTHVLHRIFEFLAVNLPVVVLVKHL